MVFFLFHIHAFIFFPIVSYHFFPIFPFLPDEAVGRGRGACSQVSRPLLRLLRSYFTFVGPGPRKHVSSPVLLPLSTPICAVPSARCFVSWFGLSPPRSPAAAVIFVIIFAGLFRSFCCPPYCRPFGTRPPLLFATDFVLFFVTVSDGVDAFSFHFVLVVSLLTSPQEPGLPKPSVCQGQPISPLPV